LISCTIVIGAYFTIEVTPVKNKEANKKKGYIILFSKEVRYSEKTLIINLTLLLLKNTNHKTKIW
jgi:hypothetical protein